MKVRRSKTIPILVLILGAVGCAQTSHFQSATGSQTKLRSVGVHPEENADSRVGTYVSSVRGFSTSSYWIEGPTGLVAIDLQFLKSATEEMIEAAERTTGKKFVLALILHPNPDKFNGTQVFQERGIPVITSSEVARFIPEVYVLRRKWFYERFKPDFPAVEPNPTVESRLPVSGATVDFPVPAAGITLRVHGFGHGCSFAHLAVEWERNLFVGDLVTNGYHAWLELGFVQEWISVLEKLSARDARLVHPGRGPSGDSNLLVQQIDYLENVLRLARSASSAEQLEEQILDRYPGLGMERFVSLGVEDTLKHATRGRRPKPKVSR